MGAVTSFLTVTVIPFINAASAVLIAAKPIFELFNKPPQCALSFEQATNAPDTPASTHSKEYWEEQRRAAHLQLGIDTVNNFNVGFCGKSKTGKSSLINSLRGVKKGEPGWAQTGVFETTIKINQYHFKEGVCQYGVLWDIPGSGTMQIPSADYFTSQKLFAFDFLVILCQKSFGEEEKGIASQAKRFGVPFAFVRSQCDIDLQMMANEHDREEPTEQDKSDFLTQGRSRFEYELKDFNDAPLFFVSSRVMMDPERHVSCHLEEHKLIKFVFEKISERRKVK